MRVNRRELLQSFLLAGVAENGSRAAQEQHHRIIPQVVGAADSRDLERIRAALAQVCRNPRGFDPARFARTFDRGAVSPRRAGSVVREFRLVASDVDLEVAPGIIVRGWTYNGTVPGPTLRCTEGDYIVIHFENNSIADHSIHFHGIHAANMDGVAEVVNPGGRFTYEFKAEPVGLQFYHCHMPPIALHMSRGLFGALIIDPLTPRADASEFVLISHGWDIDFDGRNELYAYNGPANFYRDNPIDIMTGERVRLYLLNALEYDPLSSFHLHGNFFETFRTGWNPRSDDHTDVVTLAQAERCIVEFTYAHQGRFMFHPHQNGLAEAGCMGHFDVAPATR